jgi:hypothetical protein
MTEPTAPLPRRPSPWPRILIGLGLVVVLLGGLWWWFTRPIQPVVLSPREIATVEAKLAALQGTPPAGTEISPPPANTQEPAYEPGKKEIILTEREINGLLNVNTDLGKNLNFQFGSGAVLAHFETDLDPDLPLVGGRRFKARARILISESSGQPSFIIDDLTVWGISLPNEWLGNLKGRNLLKEILGSGPEGRLPGVKSFAIEPGQLTIQLKE